jgi:predicted metalloprotease
MRTGIASAVCAVLLLAGCTRLVDGTPSGAGIDCQRRSAERIVACLARSLSSFWTDETGRPLTLRAVVDPAPSTVPRACRAALEIRTAFTCPVDGRVYLTRPFIRRMLTTGPAGQAWLRIGSTLGHEMGHVVQFAVHEPLIEKPHPSFADSRRIEQQADCLAGVWAGSVGIDRREFVAANRVVLGIVDTARERRTHGTPAARLAALRRGLAGSAAECGITVR